jgi:hypothetical protein
MVEPGYAAIVIIELFVSQFFEPCREAERVWAEVAKHWRASLVVLDIGTDRGRARACDLGVKVIPAVALGGRVSAVGVHSFDQAERVYTAAN